jgi:hypothetical protein
MLLQTSILTSVRQSYCLSPIIDKSYGRTGYGERTNVTLACSECRWSLTTLGILDLSCTRGSDTTNTSLPRCDLLFAMDAKSTSFWRFSRYCGSVNFPVPECTLLNSAQKRKLDSCNLLVCDTMSRVIEGADGTTPA